jgi:hypothetical protein
VISTRNFNAIAIWAANGKATARDDVRTTIKCVGVAIGYPGTAVVGKNDWRGVTLLEVEFVRACTTIVIVRTFAARPSTLTQTDPFMLIKTNP